MPQDRRRAHPSVLFVIGVLMLCCGVARGAEVFARCKVVRPVGDRFRIAASGFIHVANWYLPTATVDAAGSEWSEWLDLTKWPLHGRLDREGGIAEWPAMKLSVARVGSSDPLAGITVAIQLADRPDAQNVVIDFQESSESETIAFLLPHPLREHRDEFETGSQMAARHLEWAKEAAGRKPIALTKFHLCTGIWGHYDPGLARKEIEALKTLGFNVSGGVPFNILQEAGMLTRGNTWNYGADPEATITEWKNSWDGSLGQALASPEKRAELKSITEYVIADEIGCVGLAGLDPLRVNQWFRDYLRRQGVGDAALGAKIDEIAFPTTLLEGQKDQRVTALPREADLQTRKLAYYAAKFRQWWSARQLWLSSELIRGSLPWVKTDALPTDHGFFYAWGPPTIGMSFPLLDLFEIGAQRSVDVLAAEDWMGLNHMYGPDSTWTGAQTLEYLNAIHRSAIGDRPMVLEALITPSDDGYLRLKAFSTLGQGSKVFFFWEYGPTYIGTENYWSDLRSEYDGIAKFTRCLQKAEDVIFEAKSVRDPVAILYSVSHDLWHSDDPAAFVEKRLLWHALRHLSVQPDFVREEDVEAGRLTDYKVLYVVDWCVSRRASAAIDAWVKDGGIVYLSAGAATRDEFYEPYVPPFAQAVWPDDAAAKLVKEKHNYNERADLPGIKPMARVAVNFNAKGDEKGFELPVIGCRLNLREAKTDQPAQFSWFDDGSPAGRIEKHGQGSVIALGFMPMLAYGQLANFKPTTLEEKWPAEPRQLVDWPLANAKITPVAKASVPVVETSLLTGPKGSALVLVNYTYQPIKELTIDVRLPQKPTRAISCEQGRVRTERAGDSWRITLPLDWTDIVLFPSDTR